MNRILKIVVGAVAVSFACGTGVRATGSSANDLQAAYAERVEFLERFPDIVRDPQSDVVLQYLQTLSEDLSRAAFKEHLEQSLNEGLAAFENVHRAWPVLSSIVLDVLQATRFNWSLAPDEVSQVVSSLEEGLNSLQRLKVAIEQQRVLVREGFSDSWGRRGLESLSEEQMREIKEFIREQTRFFMFEVIAEEQRQGDATRTLIQQLLNEHREQNRS